MEGPGIAVLVHHPYPDASDPFGFQYLQTGTDAYWHRYQHLDTDEVPGFDFPHTVFDGIVPIEGIPEGDGPFVATEQAYASAFNQRAQVESPLTLKLITIQPADDRIQVSLRLDRHSEFDVESLRVWFALVEDPIHYEPPPALSNGVFVHPFVVRAIADGGPLSALQMLETDHTFTVPSGNGPSAWDLDRVRAVAWVQQGAADGVRFDAHEVVQAVMQDTSEGVGETVASQKVVLMEMYSATWCDTCLFGDRVAEELAVEHGVQRDLEADSVGYLREGPWILAGIGGLAAALAVAWPRLPGGRS